MAKPPKGKRSLSELAKIGAAHGIRLHACCEDALAGGMIAKAHCVETELLGAVALKASPSRAECGCVESVDIGAYDTCQFGCVYCYATNSWQAARRRALWRTIRTTRRSGDRQRSPDAIWRTRTPLPKAKEESKCSSTC